MLIFPFLLACDSEPASQAPSAPEAPAPEAAPEPAPEPPKPPAPAPSTAPFRQPVDALGRVDSFAFWGWSSDSRYFAFETYYPGSGGASCDDVATLHIVDATTDRYAAPPLTTRYPSIETDDCPGPSPQEAMLMLRPDALKQWGISADHYIAPLLNTEETSDWLVEPTSGPFFRLTLSQTGTSQPEDYVANAGFRLEMHEVGHAGVPKVIESGERHREGVISYRLAMVFPAPDDVHLAIIIETARLDFEGASYGFMSNGTTRIP